jgi:hypothetical protein
MIYLVRESDDEIELAILETDAALARYEAAGYVVRDWPAFRVAWQRRDARLFRRYGLRGTTAPTGAAIYDAPMEARTEP